MGNFFFGKIEVSFLSSSNWYKGTCKTNIFNQYPIKIFLIVMSLIAELETAYLQHETMRRDKTL